jgi:hypothetical protein
MARKSTPQQQQEILKCGRDPIYFIKKYVFIQHPTKGTLQFKTFPYQDDCINAFQEHRFNIVLKSRQLGLSTLAAAYSIWMAIFRKDKNILVIATKLKVAQNFIKKVGFALAKLPPWLVLPEITGNNKQQIEFSNGSQIKSIPTSEDAGRSEALSLVIIDEAAFIRNFESIWTSLYSTLSTGGRGIILSTPNGVGDKYHEIYSQAELGKNKFNPIKLLWDVHPERDQKWFEEESKNMSPKQVAQELMCDFVSSGNTFVDSERLNELLHGIQTPIEKSGPENGLWTWEYPKLGNNYVIAADVSRGDANDFSTCQVIDTKTSVIAAEFQGKLRPDQFAEFLYDLGVKYNKALLCPENNTFGYAVIMKLHDKNYPNLWYQNESDRFESLYSNEPKLHKIGFSTQGGSKTQILTKLEETIRNKKIIIKSSRLYNELKTFIINGKRTEASKGNHDDLVMALAIAVWIYNPEVEKSNKDVEYQAMKNAFAVNKTPKVDQNYWNNNIESSIAKNENFKNSYNSYNTIRNPQYAMANFGWLIKG